MNAPSDSDEALLGVQVGSQGQKRPPKGHLETLLTKAETEARFKPVQAFITPVIPKVASSALKAIDDAIQTAQSGQAQPLQHLRRFVRPTYLPNHLKRNRVSPLISHEGVASASLEEKERDTFQNEIANNSSNEPVLHLLVCATTDLTLEHVQALLASADLYKGKKTSHEISIITVPGLPPTSEAQAKQWSQEYWPTIYKKHNPFGAQPAFIARAATELEETLYEYMNHARNVGREVSEASIGEDIGAVVVERGKTGNSSVVMVAGDARWNLLGKCSAQQENGNGNAMAHAVLRAIGLIAKKRLDVLDPPTAESAEGDPFADVPLTRAEKTAYEESKIQPGGYLCLDLEFYLTHEPCVMCSMALLHSRVGRVVFERRMPLTGGLTADVVPSNRAENASGLGYGLFWRPELNWKFLTWQWRPEDVGHSSHLIEERTHA